MAESGKMQLCRSCGFSGVDKFCSHCGQPYQIKRITLSGLVHDVFHFFTHLDKGFGYTLKQLFVAPGKMQQAYLAGDRVRYQKPFSLFFICATIAGLGRYWIFMAVLRYHNEGSSIKEANFFHEYLVLFQIALMPINVLLTYLLFYKAKYNYAETGVFLLYTVSAFFLMVTVVSLLKFIWPLMDTAYIELPLLAIYNAITFLNFYKGRHAWLVIAKSIILIAFLFFITQLLEDFGIEFLT
jgi:hypothetical protein